MEDQGNEAARGARRRDKDIVLDRDDLGEVFACVPWSVRHYGVTAFDWGYIGPAPAELALNILNWVLPVGVDGEPGIECEDGECSAVAWRLHRSFMAEFLVRVPYEGGCLQETDVRRWVLETLAHDNAVEASPPARGWLASLLIRQ